MRILIIGAGNTGHSLAARLCEMGHDVVVIDPARERLTALESQLDILTIEGSGSSPDALEAADVGKADLLVAVTNLDEVNILSCQYAHAVGVAHKVARISDPALMRPDRLDLRKLGVDLMISHKEEAANEMHDMLRHPGLLEVADLLGGQVLLCGIRPRVGGPLLQGTLAELGVEPVLARLRFVAFMRDGQLGIPGGETRFVQGDDVYVALRPDDLPAFLDWVHPGRQPFDKIVVAGGGELGMELARRLETDTIPAVLLERNTARAEACSDVLHKVLVLHGSVSDQNTLVEAGVGSNTAFVATTGDEELNIVSCILAKKLGATFTLAQIARPEYVPIINSLGLLDRVVSPHLCMVNAVLHFVRGRHVKAAARLHTVPGELLHVAVREGHRWAGKTIRRLKVPGGCIIAAMLRDGIASVPGGDVSIEAGDQLVLFALPDRVERIEAVFSR